MYAERIRPKLRGGKHYFNLCPLSISVSDTSFEVQYFLKYVLLTSNDPSCFTCMCFQSVAMLKESAALCVTCYIKL